MLLEETQCGYNLATRNFLRVTTAIFAFALTMNLLIQRGAITALSNGLFAGLILLYLALIFTCTSMVTQVRSDGTSVLIGTRQPEQIEKMLEAVCG